MVTSVIDYDTCNFVKRRVNSVFLGKEKFLLRRRRPSPSFLIRAVAVVLCCLGFTFLICCRGSGPSAAQSSIARSLRPFNLVVVTIDTLRPDHLQCYGYQKVETPTIDSVASRGVLFENAVTQTPLTPPSHASIFTGLYPTVHGVRNTGGFVLQTSSLTLATILQREGWNTAAFVSSAVLKRAFGFNQGFSFYDDQMPRPENSRDFLDDPERRAGDTVDHALRWLDTQPDKPYFLWVHLYDPHMPYRPPSPFRESYKDHPYDGEIAYVDRELGRLLGSVYKKSSSDRTIVAVLSDHGESLGEHGEYSHGVFLYDATLRIAFLMSGPGIPSGKRVPAQARTIDFLPTVLELMGGKAPARVQGVSLTPAFAGQETGTAVSYGETLYPKINYGWAELRAIRTKRWKYVRAPKPELYDLMQDPSETNNVIQVHSAEVQRFEAQLKTTMGREGSEKVETSSLDPHTLDQLKSLGYVSGFSGSTYNLTGHGPDPKDRIAILKLLALAEDPEARTSTSRRIQILEEALKEDPGDPDLYYQLGEKYEKGDRYRDAVNLYRNRSGEGYCKRAFACTHRRSPGACRQEGRGHSGIRKSCTIKSGRDGQPDQPGGSLFGDGPDR